MVHIHIKVVRSAFLSTLKINRVKGKMLKKTTTNKQTKKQQQKTKKKKTNNHAMQQLLTDLDLVELYNGFINYSNVASMKT